jgi:FkbM family methyltransferase
MHLLVGFYRHPDERRMAELAECLRRNSANRWFASINVMIEDESTAEHVLACVDAADRHKVAAVRHGRRLLYDDLFAYAASHLRLETIVVANADIAFDDSLGRLAGRDLHGQLLCLSRWDEHDDGTVTLFEHAGSQDVWIFEAPLPPMTATFPLGVPGCDNRIAAEATLVGMRVSNPSRTIVAHHLHRSDVRSYSEASRIHGHVRHVPASELAPYRRPLYAVTSLPPDADGHTAACISSWRRAGMDVVAFNHPAEIVELRPHFDVDFVPVEATTEAIFGRRLVPVEVLLDWVTAKRAQACVINADIRLDLAAWEAQRLCLRLHGGLCCVARHNHDGDDEQDAIREAHGFDAFIVDGADAPAFESSFLSMGQPFWDYWLPFVYQEAGRPTSTLGFAAAYHRRHPGGWSWSSWHRCGVEFMRATGQRVEDFDGQGTAGRVRRAFDQHMTVTERQPMDIRRWVETTFDTPDPKTFLELGAHDGSDTAWLAAVPGVHVHAFEPDPRNVPPELPNVVVHRLAVADRDGPGELIPSTDGWGREWTYSSSIRMPKHHLDRFPVSFGEPIPVELVTLDRFCADQGIDRVDFIWADIQGAEGDMVRGAASTLARTRYLYTEYSDDELYAGQATLTEILAMLPAFRVVELWPDDVLLENTA